MESTQASWRGSKAGHGKPSTRTLERFAKATNSRLRIIFEPPAGAQRA